MKVQTIGKDQIKKYPSLISEKDLCQAVKIIKDGIGNKSLSKAIKMMNDYVVKKKPPEKVFTDYVPPTIHIPKASKEYLYVPIVDRPWIIYNYNKQELLQTSFKSDEQKKEYIARRLVAKIFILHREDYNATREQFLKVKQRLKDSERVVFPQILGQSEYKITLDEIFFLAFRKIEQFIQDNSLFYIRNLAEEEMHRVTEAILSERIYRNRSVLQKVLRWEFGLSNVQIQERQIVQLYLEIMQAVLGKKMDVHGIQIFFRRQLQSIIHIDSSQKKIYQQILQTYRRTQSYRKIFKRYQKCMTKTQCQEQILSFLRKAIETVYLYSIKLQINFPLLSPKSFQRLLTNVIVLKSTWHLRLDLMDFYLHPAKMTENEIFFMIAMVKQQVSQKQGGEEAQSWTQEQEIVMLE